MGSKKKGNRSRNDGDKSGGGSGGGFQSMGI